MRNFSNFHRRKNFCFSHNKIIKIFNIYLFIVPSNLQVNKFHHNTHNETKRRDRIGLPLSHQQLSSKKMKKTTPVYPLLNLQIWMKNTPASKKKTTLLKPNWKAPWQPETQKPRTTRCLTTNSQPNILPSMHQLLYKIMIIKSYNW